MKKFLIALIALPIFSHANVSSSGEQTYFDLLGDMMEESFVPDINVLLEEKVRSGRCFYPNSPDTPRGAIIGFEKVNVSATVGPLANKNVRYNTARKTSLFSRHFDDHRSANSLEDLLIFQHWQRYDSTEGASGNRAYGVAEGYLIEEVTGNNGITERCYYYNPGYDSSSTL